MKLLLILALTVLVLLMWIRPSDKEIDTMEFILLCLATMLVFGAFVVYGGSPMAIDVYRGKTALEITYKDSIPIDSVVVFK